MRSTALKSNLAISVLIQSEIISMEILKMFQKKELKEPMTELQKIVYLFFLLSILVSLHIVCSLLYSSIVSCTICTAHCTPTTKTLHDNHSLHQYYAQSIAEISATLTW
jgi:hypothetical protein